MQVKSGMDFILGIDPIDLFPPGWHLTLISVQACFMAILLRDKAQAFIDAFCRPETSPEDRRRIALLIGLSFIGIVFLILFAITAYLQGNITLALIDITTAVILAVNLLDASLRQQIETNILIGTVFVSLLFVYLYISGGVLGTAFVWYYTYPLITCYLLGSYRGGVTSALMLLPVLALVVFQPTHTFFVQYSPNFVARFMAAYFVVVLFSYLFERTRESNREELRAINKTLEKLVAERTSDLVATNEKLGAEVERRKQAHETMQLSQEILLTILDSIEATIYVADMETYEILFINKYMREVFGADSKGKRCWQVFRNETGPCRDCSNPHLVDEHNDSTGVFTWEGQNPITGRWYINYDRAIRWTDGRMVRIQIAFDVTEYRHTEEKLRQAQKMESIGTLAGGIAHDFNNLLSIIIGNIELVLYNASKDENVNQNLEEIKTAGFRAKEIVAQLLSFSRMTNVEYNPHALVPIIRDAVKFLRSAIPSTISLDLNCRIDAVTVLAEPTQLYQVMMNLCTNASQAMEYTGGKITIELKQVTLGEQVTRGGTILPVGEYAQVRITDNGPGIETDTLPHIFDPYFTTKAVGKGSGMGLAVVHGIVKNHNGSIVVDSERGEGTVFTILFPIVQEEPIVAPQPVRELPKGSEKILFVDDEELLVRMGRQQLRRLGYEVAAFQHPDDALEAFAARPDDYDLVITDMTMPQMNGVALGDEIRKIKADIPIVICSGHSDIIGPDNAIRMGFAAFLRKPVVLSELARTVRKVLDQAPQETSASSKPDTNPNSEHSSGSQIQSY